MEYWDKKTIQHMWSFSKSKNSHIHVNMPYLPEKYRLKINIFEKEILYCCTCTTFSSFCMITFIFFFDPISYSRRFFRCDGAPLSRVCPLVRPLRLLIYPLLEVFRRIYRPVLAHDMMISLEALSMFSVFEKHRAVLVSWKVRRENHWSGFNHRTIIHWRQNDTYQQQTTKRGFCQLVGPWLIF